MKKLFAALPSLAVPAAAALDIACSPAAGAPQEHKKDRKYICGALDKGEDYSLKL